MSDEVVAVIVARAAGAGDVIWTPLDHSMRKSRPGESIASCRGANERIHVPHIAGAGRTAPPSRIRRRSGLTLRCTSSQRRKQEKGH
jgi:hypothetical protein